MASSSVWIPVVTGNVEIVSTDPTYHYKFNQIHDTVSPLPPQMTLICDGIMFATAKAGKTGAWLSTSCTGSASKSVSFLDPFGAPGFIQVCCCCCCWLQLASLLACSSSELVCCPPPYADPHRLRTSG